MLCCYVKAKSSPAIPKTYCRELADAYETIYKITFILDFWLQLHNIFLDSKEVESGPLNWYRETSLFVDISESL